MIEKLIVLIVVGAVLYILWLLTGMLIGGVIHVLIGIVLVLVFLAYILRTFGITKL
jgi:hypothetical protein